MTDHPTPRPRPARGPAPLLGALALATLLTVSAAACSAGGGSSPSATPSAPSAPPSAAPSDGGASDAPIGEVPPAVVDNAIADAAERAGVDPSEVTVVLAEAREFPNGALGCPQPGMMYTEVITPGYRVVVNAGGTEYDYRASARSSDVRWCEDPPPM